MERLTENKIGASYPLKDKASSKKGLFTDYDGFYAFFEAVNRLGEIEDILGEDYDLERLAVMMNQCMSMRDEVQERFRLTAKIPLDQLKELVELAKNIPHVCKFCVGCEMEPKDGHGCDENDSFVFSTRRLQELADADLDGRCVVLQKEVTLKKGDKVWYVDRENGEIESGTVFLASYKKGKLDSFSVDFDCGDFDEFFGEAFGRCFFSCKEAADAAIKGERDGKHL